MKCALRVFQAPVAVLVLVAGVWFAGGCAAPQEPAEETPAEKASAAGAETEDEMVEYLFVQHSEGATLKDGVLTLEGVGPDLLYFSDRPHRIVGRQALDEFLAAWTQGADSFEEIPPNAVLTTKQGDELRNLVVVLMNPIFSDGTLTYEVEILDGPKSGSGGFAALFIDVISVGHPSIGPTSPRGAARRTARRTTRRVNRRYEAMEDAEYYDDDYYGGGGTVEEQLRELDDLLDQGLITQEDYDREKDEILAGV